MNREMVVTDDVPGAFAREVISAFVERPGRRVRHRPLGRRERRGPATSGWPLEGAQAVDWLVVNFFWGDELCVPPDHPESNERLGRQALLERVGAANAVYPMRCEDGLDAYQLRLGEIGQLDVVHLGRSGLTAASPASSRARRRWTPTPANW